MKTIKLDKISTIAELSDLSRIWSVRKTRLENWLHFSEVDSKYKFHRNRIKRLYNEMIRRYQIVDSVFDDLEKVLHTNYI